MKARHDYGMGRDVLGADVATSRGILIRVRNSAELARSQGAVASLAAALAPATVEGKVYDEMAKQLKDSLAAKGVDADVSIVEPKNFAGPNGSHVGRDVVIGLVGIGAVAAGGTFLWRMFSRKGKRR